MLQRSKTKSRAARKEVLRASFSRWNAVFLLAGMVLTVGLYFLGVMIFSRPQTAPAQTIPHRSEPMALHREVSIGPWGALHITRVALDRPEEYFSTDQAPPPVIRWFFNRQTPAQLTTFFKETQLPDSFKARLTDTNRWEMGPAGIWVEPGLDLIREMKPDARATIYRVLSMNPENRMHRNPFRFEREETKRLLFEAGLSPESIERIEQLTYRRGEVICFSDLDYLGLTLPPDEMLKAARILTRVPSLLVKLRITPDTDLDSVLDYWGSTRTVAYKLRPFLESIKRLPEGGTVDISWFFASVARSLVHTYPNPANAVGGKYPDCFWTSLNFFNEIPTPLPMDAETIRNTLMTEYHPVSKPELFGDLVLFYEPLGGGDIFTVHLCVYIADGIVFTKNGYDPRQPWVLAPLKEVTLLYAYDQALQLAFFRRNMR
jgi:hypothetical protein